MPSTLRVTLHQTGATITVKLYAAESSTELETVSLTEQSRAYTYSGTTTGTFTGDHECEIFAGGNRIGSGWVRLTDGETSVIGDPRDFPEPSTPPTASAIATQVDTTLTASHGSGSWGGPTAASIASEVDAELSAAHGSGAWTTAAGTGDATAAKQDQILTKLNGPIPTVTSRTKEGAKLTTYIGDDDVGENKLEIIVEDVGETLRTSLLAASSVIFGAGSGEKSNQITGTISNAAADITHDSDGNTHLFVSIASADKPTKPGCLTYHVKEIDSNSKEYVRIQSTITVETERAKVVS